MLEAIRDRAQGWIAKLILALIIVPFALWGVDSYFKGDGKEPPVASVGKEDISQREFFKALQDQRDAVQNKLQVKVDIENKDFRKGILDKMIDGRLMSIAGSSNGLIAPEGDLDAMIHSAPIFQENGAYSEQRFQEWLRKQGLNRAGLIHALSQDILGQQFQVGYGQGAIASNSSVTQIAGLLAQQREVNEATFNTSDYAKSVTIDDKAVAAEYDAHKQDYTTPEEVKVQYLVLSADAIKSGISISDQAARQYYESNLPKFQGPEMRHASHILIKADSSMTAAERDAAKAKAEKLYQELSADPSRFAELAKKDSQDPGSAANGGDLGEFTRDSMVKPFADAVFAMKVGELSKPVLTEFGYHIIRLDGIKPGTTASFESVKGEIVSQLAEDKAMRTFADEAEKFNNVVYEQADSLDPAAKQFQLKVMESGWISRGQATPAFLAKPELMDQLLSPDALQQHHNTEAVEVSPNTLVSARVIDHKAAGTRPLAEVAASIRQKLTEEAARNKAIEAGQQALKAAQSGQAVSGFGAPMLVSRMKPLNLPRESIKAIFGADSTKLPVTVGVETPDGYRLYRIAKVIEGTPDPAQHQQLQQELTSTLRAEEMRAYLEFVKSKAKVKINEAILEKKAE